VLLFEELKAPFQDRLILFVLQDKNFSFPRPIVLLLRDKGVTLPLSFLPLLSHLECVFKELSEMPNHLLRGKLKIVVDEVFGFKTVVLLGF
jgi:hypothetical protein